VRLVARPAAPEPKASLDLVPLTDLSGDETYKGQSGGLYGQGRNTPPEEHLKSAISAADRIQPLDAEGEVVRERSDRERGPDVETNARMLSAPPGEGDGDGGPSWHEKPGRMRVFGQFSLDSPPSGALP